MKKIIISLSSLLIAVTIIMQFSLTANATELPDGFIGRNKGLLVSTPEPAFKLATPAPDFKLVTPAPDFKLATPAPEFKLATPTPDLPISTLPPEYKIPKTTPVPDFKLATPTPDLPIGTLPPDLKLATAAPATASPVPTSSAVSSGNSLPVITKHPGAETVDLYGQCTFVARANNYKTISWFFTDGTDTVSAADAPDYFAGLKISGEATEKIILSNIPGSLTQWQVGAEFSNNAGSIKTNTCSITVKNATPAPKSTPTPEPTAAPTPEPTPVPVTEPTPSPVVSTPEPTSTPTGEPTTEPTLETNDNEPPKSDHTVAYIVGGVIIVTLICATVLLIAYRPDKYRGKHSQ